MRSLALVISLVLCVGALAASAAAKPRKHKAPVPAAGLWKGARLDSGSALRFRVAKDHLRIGRISANLLEDCAKDEPPTTTTLASRGGWKIKRGRFGGRRRERSGRITSVVTIAGQFTSRTRASGILRQRTTVGGITCDSGRLPFVAVRR